MSADQWAVVGIASGWAGGVGVVGLFLGWMLRRGSLRWMPALVAAVAVGAMVAATVGTSRAMFLSDHDFGVVIVVSVVAAVVALLFSLAVGSMTVRSSRLLRDEARRFGDSGEFTPAQNIPAELADLSAELARTSERLQETRAREQRLETSRRELVSWVSHDLRTPLAGLRAMTEAIEDGLAEDVPRYQAQMRTEVDRMVGMVDDLFELSRIHAGVLPLSLETVPLRDLVSETLAGAYPMARAKGIVLAGSVGEDVLVRADPGGLSRVMANLVMNAIRHTPADGVVAIRGRTVADAVELTVADGCGGIPPEDLLRVFDLAWRGGGARTPSADSGAGLGLAIVKGIIEAHHGTVAVANEAPGCRFLVRLPG